MKIKNNFSRALMLLVIACIGATAQDVWKYSTSGTLSSASASFTVALPATGNNQVDLLDYVLQCTASCTVSTFINQTAPTATLAAWRAENPSTTPDGGATQPKALIYTASNSTGGTKADEPFVLPANAIMPWDLQGITLIGSGTTKNYTVKIGPFTATTTYTIQIRVKVRR